MIFLLFETNVKKESLTNGLIDFLIPNNHTINSFNHKLCNFCIKKNVFLKKNQKIMTVQDFQLQLIKAILKINNLGVLKTLTVWVQKWFPENGEAANDDYIHPEGVPFGIWNAQFNDAD